MFDSAGNEYQILKALRGGWIVNQNIWDGWSYEGWDRLAGPFRTKSEAESHVDMMINPDDDDDRNPLAHLLPK